MTAGFFDVLGVRPALGRGLTTAEDQPGAGPVVVLGNKLWRDRFGADRSILGTTATLDGVTRTIVGVMPPGFNFPNRADLWLPLATNPLLVEGLSFSVVARLGENMAVALASHGDKPTLGGRALVLEPGRSPSWREHGGGSGSR